MFLITEKEIAGFDVLMQNIIRMTIGQSSCCLQSQSTELVHIAIEFVILEGSTFQMFHQLIIAVLTIYVKFTIIQQVNNYLEIEIINRLKKFLVNIEIGVVNFQDELGAIFINEKHLSFTRIITQTLHLSIFDTFEVKKVAVKLYLLWYRLRRTHGRLTC